jgi:hypothetical protein
MTKLYRQVAEEGVLPTDGRVLVLGRYAGITPAVHLPTHHSRIEERLDSLFSDPEVWQATVFAPEHGNSEYVAVYERVRQMVLQTFTVTVSGSIEALRDQPEGTTEQSAARLRSVLGLALQDLNRDGSGLTYKLEG